MSSIGGRFVQPHARYQQGATLIVVMVMLLLVTVVGVLAMRVAMTSLNISTNSQIGQLLVQSADTPINEIMKVAQNDAANFVSYSSVIGAALKESEVSPEAEYIFCYKPTSTTVKFGQFVDATLLKPGAADIATVIDGGVRGFCDLSADFGSMRQAAITQVAITIPLDANDGIRGSNLVRGTNLSDGTPLPKTLISKQRIRMITTSMLPAYATTSLANIQSECLSTANAKISDNLDPANQSKQSLADCLRERGMPVNTQVQEFNYANILTQEQAPGA
jgi:hypothetical protein